MNWEFSVLDFMLEHVQNDGFSNILRWVTYTGDGALIWFLVAIFLIIYPKTRGIGITCLISLIFFAGLNVFVLKNVFERDRPFITNPFYLPYVEKWFYQPGSMLFGFAETPSGYSFLSGHTVGGVVVVTILGAAFKSIQQQESSRVLKGINIFVLSVLILWMTLIAFSRLYFLVHYPSDIICGALYGIMGGIIGYFFYVSIRDRSEAHFKAKAIKRRGHRINDVVK
ncbi:MAG: phosphatase PAP2 family protein [Erysipelotrichaceae bacterium]|jgi:undecaprenyl-diphosphatase|nr:phosphatase PAP2 family protein [Erysipelotrichaceae bacterium]